MFRTVKFTVFSALLLIAARNAASQSKYQVVSVSNAGTITGSVQWAGPAPRALTFPITKDPAVCDPESRKKVDLERLIVGPQGGVANTVVFLKYISSGKAMDIPETRRHLDQRHCHYEPHIMLVPESGPLQMKSSDPVLHTIHMDGAATFNLPFPFTNQVISRNMPSTGLVNLRCNGGHVWMNAEVFVVPHPYYAVTDESGKFELTAVPPGEYAIVAWHEGWGVARQETAFDVLTERRVQRPVFTPPKTWEKKVSVNGNEMAVVNFVISDK
ncbi:MAG: hypothetical protein DMG72_15180 [Acidobacteria bacterium]|nr:MAG: hypothetical protein DMG72_15180 [Acidobacteriota bacterium]